MTYGEFIDVYEKFILDTLGYTTAIHLEEIILVLAGFFLGEMFMSWLAGSFIYKLNKVEDFTDGKVQYMRLHSKGNNQYLIHFRTLSESIETVLYLAFSPFFTIKTYTLRDKNRTKWCLIIMMVTGVLLIIFAILSISTNFIPPEHPLVS